LSFKCRLFCITCRPEGPNYSVGRFDKISSHRYGAGVTQPPTQKRARIDLMKSEYDELAANLAKARRTTHFIFTPAHKSAFSSRLDPKLFSESPLLCLSATRSASLCCSHLEGQPVVNAARIHALRSRRFSWDAIAIQTDHSRETCQLVK
jgi:hypothetical protein